MFIDFILHFTKHGRLKRKVDTIMEKVSNNEKCSVEDFAVIAKFMQTIPLPEEILLNHLHKVLIAMLVSGTATATKSKAEHSKGL